MYEGGEVCVEMSRSRARLLFFFRDLFKIKQKKTTICLVDIFFFSIHSFFFFIAHVIVTAFQISFLVVKRQSI
jgi:hypothetical protein